MLTARIGPNTTLPLYMAVWGALCAVGAACKSFGSLTAVRLLLGALEAGFAPSMILMLTLYYTRGSPSHPVFLAPVLTMSYSTRR